MGERVVLGMSSTVDDEIVWDQAVLADLVVELGIEPKDLGRRESVDDLRGLVAALLSHVAEGSGRSTTSPPPSRSPSSWRGSRTDGPSVGRACAQGSPWPQPECRASP